MTFRDATGTVVFDTSGRSDRQPAGFEESLTIAAGRYTITVEDASGRSATTIADVHAAEPPLVLALPVPPTK